MRESYRNRASSAALLVVGAVLGMAFLLNCGGGGAGAPAVAASTGFMGTMHENADPGGPYTVPYTGAPVPVQLRSILFTPQGANDVLLSVTAEGTCITPDAAVGFALEVYLGNAELPVATEALALPAGSDGAFHVSLSVAGACPLPGGAGPANSYGVRAYALSAESGMAGESAQFGPVSFRLLCLEDVSVQSPSGQIAVSLQDVDSDQDGYSPRAGDCDDQDPDVNPGEQEVRGNGKDDNCDGRVDEPPPPTIVTLQCDEFGPLEPQLAFQTAFIAGDAVGKTLGPAPFNLDLETIRFAWGPQAAQQSTYTLKLYAEANDPIPGALLHETQFQTAGSSDTLLEIDISAANLTLGAGESVRVVIEFSGTTDMGPAIDNPGAAPDLYCNWVYTAGAWYSGIAVGLNGDWVIRVVGRSQ